MQLLDPFDLLTKEREQIHSEHLPLKIYNKLINPHLRPYLPPFFENFTFSLQTISTGELLHLLSC